MRVTPRYLSARISIYAVVCAIGICAGSMAPAVFGAGEQDAATACDALVNLKIPASSIAMPTNGATVNATKLMPASADFGEYCVVQGSIAPVADGFPINFQINLPTNWNGRAVHFGGGGFDGTVVAGLNAFGEGHPKEKRPLAAGFVTFGSDSGHSNAADGKPIYSQNLQGGPGQNGQLVAPGQGLRMNATFAQSKEAMANFGGDQLKKTHDVAIEIIKKRYGRAPEKMYFSGHSQGGHEAVLVTQRFGKDYDGVFGGAPVLDVTGRANRLPLEYPADVPKPRHMAERKED